MKSTVLVGTLAASLVSTLHAEVFVLGASWRERSITAPDGVLERKMRNASAPRAYVIVDNATNPLGTAFIEYNNDRTTGKTYTVTTNFTGFTADVVKDANASSNRMFGHIFTPVKVADVPNAMMPFSGSVHGNFTPRRLTFDKMVFQSGDSTEVAGPNLISPGTVFRSLVSGAGSTVKVESTTLAFAIQELTERLDLDGYVRQAVAPVITTEPTAVVRTGFDPTKSLSVSLGADVFPTPTYQWFKKEVAGNTLVGTSATYLLPGGAAGDGTYFVIVSTAAGSDTSADAVVTTTNVAPNLGTNNGGLPATLAVASNATVNLSPVINANVYPQAVTYQWAKSTTSATAGFTNIAVGLNGTVKDFPVTGSTAVTPLNNGPGWYRVTITNSAGNVTSTATQITTAP